MGFIIIEYQTRFKQRYKFRLSEKINYGYIKIIKEFSEGFYKYIASEI